MVSMMAQRDGLSNTVHHIMANTNFPRYSISIYSDIGGRKHQEDRFTFSPQLIQGNDQASFFGVFDGTVGDFASDTVKDLVIPHLLDCPVWSNIAMYVNSAPNSTNSANMPQLLTRAIEHMYVSADNALVKRCAELNKDYASCTSVTALLAGEYLGIGHLGDSRIAMGVKTLYGIKGEFLTIDHKPDMATERQRIMQNGGSVEYLHNHNNKPFIRGGDFAVRKSRGEQPMQLQYSRAFGGKDLKKYGLSNQPDVRIIKLMPEHTTLVLATDGLWDVISAQDAVIIADQDHGYNTAQSLVDYVLKDQQSRGQCADNITAMVVKFKH